MRKGALCPSVCPPIRMLTLFHIMPVNRLFLDTKIDQKLLRATGQSKMFWKRVLVTAPRDESNVSAFYQNKVILVGSSAYLKWRYSSNLLLHSYLMSEYPKPTHAKIVSQVTVIQNMKVAIGVLVIPAATGL